MKTKLTGHSITPGNPNPPTTQPPYHAINPTTNQPLQPPYHPLHPDAAQPIAQQAQNTFPKYAQTNPQQKAAFLRQIAHNIETNTQDLIQRTTAETALPETRIRAETARTTHQLRLFADLIQQPNCLNPRIDTPQPNRKPIPKPDIRSLLQPIGPILIFCAGNFPLAFSVAGGDTAAALAAGCPVIIKAHHSHPGTAEIIGQTIQQAAQTCNIPTGTFTLIHGHGKQIGQTLAQHPAIAAIAFTGSRAGGTTLAKTAANRPQPIPIYAEMSSTNPIILLPQALQQNQNQILQNLHNSITLGLGQFCTNPGIILIPQTPEAQTLTQQLKQKLQQTPPGHALNHNIAQTYRQTLQQFNQTTATQHHNHPANQPQPQNDPPNCQIGTALYQTDTQTYLNNPTLQQEAFGPATLLITYQNLTQLQNLLQNLQGQLTATIHAAPTEHQTAQTLLTTLQQKAGRLLINDYPTGLEVSHATIHGGPYPATTNPQTTSVGTLSIQRFLRPICYQNTPDNLLPDPLKNHNPLNLTRLINGKPTNQPIQP